MNDVQKKVRQFVEMHDLNTSPEIRFLDLVSELGEVSKEVLIANKYGRKETEPSDKLKMELGDLMFSLACFANELEIDLEEALELALKKYDERVKKGDGPGSETDD